MSISVSGHIDSNNDGKVQKNEHIKLKNSSGKTFKARVYKVDHDTFGKSYDLYVAGPKKNYKIRVKIDSGKKLIGSKAENYSTTSLSQKYQVAKVAVRFRGLAAKHKNALIDSMYYKNGKIYAKEPIKGNTIVIADGFKSKNNANSFITTLRNIHYDKTVASVRKNVVSTAVKYENSLRRTSVARKMGLKTVSRGQKKYNYFSLKRSSIQGISARSRAIYSMVDRNRSGKISLREIKNAIFDTGVYSKISTVTNIASHGIIERSQKIMPNDITNMLADLIVNKGANYRDIIATLSKSNDAQIVKIKNGLIALHRNGDLSGNKLEKGLRLAARMNIIVDKLPKYPPKLARVRTEYAKFMTLVQKHKGDIPKALAEFKSDLLSADNANADAKLFKAIVRYLKDSYGKSRNESNKALKILANAVSDMLGYFTGITDKKGIKAVVNFTNSIVNLSTPANVISYLVQSSSSKLKQMTRLVFQEIKKSGGKMTKAEMKALIARVAKKMGITNSELIEKLQDLYVGMLKTMTSELEDHPALLKKLNAGKPLSAEEQKTLQRIMTKIVAKYNSDINDLQYLMAEDIVNNMKDDNPYKSQLKLAMDILQKMHDYKSDFFMFAAKNRAMVGQTTAIVAAGIVIAVATVATAGAATGPLLTAAAIGVGSGTGVVANELIRSNYDGSNWSNTGNVKKADIAEIVGEDKVEDSWKMLQKEGYINASGKIIKSKSEIDAIIKKGGLDVTKLDLLKLLSRKNDKMALARGYATEFITNTIMNTMGLGAMKASGAIAAKFAGKSKYVLTALANSGEAFTTAHFVKAADVLINKIAMGKSVSLDDFYVNFKEYGIAIVIITLSSMIGAYKVLGKSSKVIQRLQTKMDEAKAFLKTKIRAKAQTVSKQKAILQGNNIKTSGGIIGKVASKFKTKVSYMRKHAADISDSLKNEYKKYGLDPSLEYNFATLRKGNNVKVIVDPASGYSSTSVSSKSSIDFMKRVSKYTDDGYKPLAEGHTHPVTNGKISVLSKSDAGNLTVDVSVTKGKIKIGEMRYKYGKSLSRKIGGGKRYQYVSKNAGEVQLQYRNTLKRNSKAGNADWISGGYKKKYDDTYKNFVEEYKLLIKDRDKEISSLINKGYPKRADEFKMKFNNEKIQPLVRKTEDDLTSIEKQYHNVYKARKDYQLDNTTAENKLSKGKRPEDHIDIRNRKESLRTPSDRDLYLNGRLKLTSGDVDIIKSEVTEVIERLTRQARHGELKVASKENLLERIRSESAEVLNSKGIVDIKHFKVWLKQNRPDFHEILAAM